MVFTPRLIQLNDLLADLIPHEKNIEFFIKKAGVARRSINLKGDPLIMWNSVLSEAQKLGKVDDLINVILERFPQNPYLKSALSEEEINYSLSSFIDEQTDWKPIDDNTLEVLTFEENTLLPISFLQRGIDSSRSVAKVDIKKGTSRDSGTGFIFKIDEFNELFFMTNFHVINDKKLIPQTRIIFNYEEDILGETKISKSFTIDPDGPWYTSPISECDVTIFKLNATTPEIQDFNFLTLKKIEVKKNDFVNIIHHPGGLTKRISLYHNIVTSVDIRTVQYLTDTLKGSSGAPVFNSDWDIVALHHSGGPKKTGEGVKESMFRNEGININLIIDFLISKHTN